MHARGVRQSCRSLIVVGVVAGAVGPVLAQGASLDQPPPVFAAPVFQEVVPGLPKFLDEDSVLELHSAWRLRAIGEDTSVAAEVEKSPSDTDPAMTAARAAMKRSKEVAGRAADVRSRAEALSQLFGATAQDDEPDAPATITTASTPENDEKTISAKSSVPVVDAVDVAPVAESPVEETASVKELPPLDPPYAVGGPPLPVEPDQGQTAVLSSPNVAGNGPSDVQPRVTDLPPLPKRAPPVDQQKSATASPAPSVSRAPRRPKPNPAYIFPNELRAFGWNTQPE
ncbi:MAG: hypothetical protein CMK33_03410 [Porticoccaceae bacterium]|nr:hypothetical protein [Porticoccaceae bacterium]